MVAEVYIYEDDNLFWHENYGALILWRIGLKEARTPTALKLKVSRGTQVQSLYSTTIIFFKSFSPWLFMAKRMGKCSEFIAKAVIAWQKQ